MSSWRAIDNEALRSVLTKLPSRTWTWTTDELDALANDLGWDVVETLPGKGAIAEAHWGIGEDEIEMSFTGDRVNSITMRVTEYVPANQADGQAFLQDAFAEVVGTTTDVLGEPTSRTLGQQPHARWRGADATILVYRFGTAVDLVWANNEWQDHWDKLQGDGE